MHTKLEEWLWLFIGSDEKVNEASKKNKEIEKIKKKLASMSLSPEERNNYEYRLKAIRDEADAIEFATRKGLEQGLAQGLEQGIEQGQAQGIAQKTEEFVKKLLERNTKIEDIIELTGITEDELNEIKKKIQKQ